MTLPPEDQAARVGALTPRAFDQATQLPFDTASGNIFLDEHELAAAFTVDNPDLIPYPERARGLARRVLAATEIAPEISSWARVNLQTAAVMSSDDYLRMRAGQNLMDAQEWSTGMASVFAAAQQEFLARAGGVYRAEQVLGRRARMRGFFDEASTFGETVDPGEFASAVRDLFPDEYHRRIAQVGQVVGRGGEWAVDGSGNLALRIADPRKGDRVVLIRLDPGTDVRTTGDALLAYLEANAGKAHSVDATSDTIPHGQTAVGGLLERMGDMVRSADRLPGVSHVFNALNRENTFVVAAGTPPEEAAAVVREREARHAVAALPDLQYLTPRGQLLLGAHALVGDGFGADEAVLAMQHVDVDAEEISESERLTVEELVEQYTESISQRGPVSEFLEEEVLEPGLALMQMWDGYTQFLGVHSIDAVTDLFQGVVGLGSAGLDVGEGLERFKAAFEATDATRISEDIGVEGDLAFWIDMAGGMAFDPFIAFSLGGRGAWSAAKAALSDPAQAAVWIRSHPASRSFAKQIADGNVATVVMATGGRMESRHLRRLLDIATEGGTVDDVFSVMDDAIRNSAWHPHFAERFSHRQATLGFARAVEKWDVLPKRTQEWLRDFYAKAAPHRAADLSDTGFLREQMDRIVVLFPDAEDQALWLRRSADAWDEARGAVDERTVLVAAKVQAVEAELRVARAASAKPVGVLKRDMARLDQLNAGIDEMLELGPLPQGSDVWLSTRDELAESVAERAPAAAAAQERARELTKQLNRLRVEEARLTDPLQRASLARVVAEMEQEIGKALKLEPTGTPHPLLEGEELLDWQPVTGLKSRNIYESRRVLDGEAFTAGLEPRDVAVLDNADIFGRSGFHPLQASTYEILAYRVGGPALAKLRDNATWNAARKFFSGLNSVFFASVLWNPITAGKITFDETLRFLIDSGHIGRFLQSTIGGLPGMGAVAKIPGLRFLNPVGEQADAWTAAFARRGQFGERLADWTMIERSNRIHPRAAERWINQHLIGNDAFQAYARGRAAFRAWWDEVGKARMRRTAVEFDDQGVRRTVKIDEDLAYQAMDNGFNVFFDDDVLKEAILAAARKGEQIPWNAALFKRAPAVPGQDLSARGVVGAMNDFFFSGPQQRRMGVFYRHYAQQHREILEARFAGRVLDQETLMSKMGLDAVTADEMIAMGRRSPQIRELLRRDNLVLRVDIDQAVNGFASDNANRLMYQLGAVSVAGRRAGNVYPFVRAHVDFLDWYTRRLFQPTQFGPASTPLRKLANVVPGVNVGTGTARTLPVPLNVRLWAEYAHMVNAVEASKEERSWLTPAAIVEAFTFLPARFDDSFLTYIVPGLGPVPSWMIGALDSAHPIREVAADLHPQLDYIQGRTGWDDALDQIIPRTGRSVRNVLGSTFKRYFTNIADDIPGPMQELLTVESRPFALKTFEADWFGDWLRDNITTARPDSDEFAAAMADGYIESWTKALQREGTTGLARLNPAFDILYNDYRHLRHMDGLVAALPNLVARGVVADSTAEELNDLWERFTSGTDDPEELRLLADAAMDVLFNDLDAPLGTRPDGLPYETTHLDYLILTQPQTVVNAAARSIVEMDPESGQPIAPEQYWDAIVDGRLVTPDIELRAKFFEEGWMRERPLHEWGPDAVQRYWDAARRYTRDLFNAMMVDSAAYWAVDEDTGRLRPPWEISNQKRFKEATIAVPADHPEMQRLNDLGVIFPTESLQDGHYVLTGEQYREAFIDARTSWPQRPFADSVSFKALSDPRKWMQSGVRDEYAFALSKGLLDTMEDFDRHYEQTMGITSPADWPQTDKDEFRRRFALAVELFDDFDRSDYNRDFLRYFGELDFEAALPPDEASLDKARSGSPDEVRIVDGDTVAIPAANGESLRLRIIGINAPERGEEGYSQAIANLNALFEEGERVTFGLYQPELYGVQGRFFGDEGVQTRVNVFMFVDGVLIADPTLFTADNPRGVGIGGKPLDLLGILHGKEAS